MGLLSEIGDTEPPPPGQAVGDGRAFVEWWRNVADAQDRATVRAWVDTPPQRPGHKTYDDIAVALASTGHQLGARTIAKGVKALRRLGEWDT